MRNSKSVNRIRKSENAVIHTFIKVQIFGLTIYLLLFLLSGFIVMSADLKHSYDLLFSLATFAVCSFITAFYAGTKIRERGIIVGLIYTLPLNTLVMLVSLIFADFKADYIVLISVVILLLSGVIGGITGVNLRLRR